MLMLPNGSQRRVSSVICFFFFLFFLLTVSVPPSEVVIALELGLQSEKSTRPSEFQIQVLEFAACVLLTTESALQCLCHL